MSGSELSLTIPSRHVALCDSGRPAAAYTQFLRRRRWPSPLDYGLGSAKDPTNPLHVGGIISELHYGSLSLQPVDSLALLTDLTGLSPSH
jgi:hypothetical protein